jgi:hypothetical protein
MERFQPIPAFNERTSLPPYNDRMMQQVDALVTERSQSESDEEMEPVNLRGATGNQQAMFITDPYNAEVGLMKAYELSLKRRKAAVVTQPISARERHVENRDVTKEVKLEWIPYAAKKMNENTSAKATTERQTNISKVISEVRALANSPHSNLDTIHGSSQRGVRLGKLLKVWYCCIKIFTPYYIVNFLVSS